MQLTRKQFDILEFIALNSEFARQKLQEYTGTSFENIEKTLKELSDLGYVNNVSITEEGLQALEPYRVKRAVFNAAGFGSRLAPVTLKTPKPLIKIHGKRIIDTLLDAVLAAGIDEIYIVRGYLAEQFNQLLSKYPMIKFIENPSYNESNNISSALFAKDFLSDAYVFDADLYLSNPRIISKYQYCSNILGIKKERTEDWCLITSEDGTITDQHLGGINCYLEVGIYYVGKDDGERLATDLEKAYNMPGGREIYWDQVPLKLFKNKYSFKLRECGDSDVVEIDTLRDLQAIDDFYKVYTD